MKNVIEALSTEVVWKNISIMDLIIVGSIAFVVILIAVGLTIIESDGLR